MKGENVEYEYSESILEDVAANKRVETSSGKNYFGLRDEWDKWREVQ